MNKALVIGGVVAGAGLLGWLYFRSRPALTGVPTNVNPSLVTQPAMQYPFMPTQPPRVDNQSQPWYGGSRLFNLTPDANLSNLTKLAGDVSAVSSIADSVSSLWDNLDVAGWFSGGEDTFSLDQVGGGLTDSFDWGSFGSQFSFSSVV